MIERNGSIWDIGADAVVIPTNSGTNKDREAIMGKGVAKQAADKYPYLAATLGQDIYHHGVRVVHFPIPKGHNIIIFPTKTMWHMPAKIDLIESSAKALVTLVDFNVFGWTMIALPRVGCGEGKLKWPDVKAVLEPLLDDRFVVCSLYGHK